MAVSIREAQDRLLRSGVLNNLGNPDVPNPLPYDSIIEEVVQIWAEQSMIPAVKESIIRKKVVASKELLQSVAPNIVVRGNNAVRFSLMMAQHWAAADTGRRPGKRPPIKAIEQWITFKGIQVRQSKGDKKLSVMQRRRQMAFAISRSIGAKGTIKRFNYQGSNYLSAVAPEQFKVLSDLVSRSVGYSIILDISLSFKDPSKSK